MQFTAAAACTMQAGRQTPHGGRFLRPSQQQSSIARASCPASYRLRLACHPVAARLTQTQRTCLTEHACQTQRWPAVAPGATWVQPSAGRHRTCRLALEVQCSPKEAQQRKRQHGCSLQEEASSPAQGPCYCASQNVACRSVLASMGMQLLAEGSGGHRWPWGMAPAKCFGCQQQPWLHVCS